MKNFKKLISVILTLVMVMSVMPVGMIGAAEGTSSGSADPYPAGAIGLFYEDFEDYTVGESILAKTGDLWEFRGDSNNSQPDSTDKAEAVDVSSIAADSTKGFSGKALMLHNQVGSNYNIGNMLYRLNLENAIDLNNAQYADKKLVIEADIIHAPVSGHYTGDYQSSLFVPTEKDVAAWNSTGYSGLYTASWKSTIFSGGKVRFETGGWANNNTGATLMWYNYAPSTQTINNKAGNVKFAFDFNDANVDVVSAWVNGVKITDTLDRQPFTGHAMNDVVMDEFTSSSAKGQGFSFPGAITGFWGNVSAATIYMDNLKIYLVDALELESVSGNVAAFDPATDALEFNFNNDIDAESLTGCAELLDASGNVVENGITDVALKDSNTVAVKITEAVLGQTDYSIRVKGVADVYGNAIQSGYEYYEYPINDYYTLSNNAGSYEFSGTSYDFTYVPGSPAQITANGKTSPIDCYIKKEGTAVGSFTTCTLLEYENAQPANESITDYVQGQQQRITLQFNDLLADTVDIANAFEVKDEAGNTIEGLSAAFGTSKDIVVLELGGLILGEGVHTITSKEHALFNSANKYANISYKFDTLDFTATTVDDITEYMPTTEATINVELSLPTVLTNDNILTGFETVDGEGNPVTGLAAELINDGKTVVLSLAGMDVDNGSVTIKSTSALADNRGRTAAFEMTFDVIGFDAVASESSGFQLKPGEDKTVTITLSLPTTIADINAGFEVVDQAGNKYNGLVATLSGDSKTVTLQLNNLVLDNGKYYIKSTAALTDEIGRQAEVNLMFNVAREVILFEEDFEFGYTLNENWINDNNKVSTGTYSVANGAWDIQNANASAGDVAEVVSAANLGGNFSGNALRLYNEKATSYSSGHFSIRRNFNGADGISLTSGEYAGKKLVYEADIFVKNAAGKYTSDHQSSFFAVSRKQGTIHEYYDYQWKPSFQGGSSGAFRVEEGTYAASSYGPVYMWYNSIYGSHKYGDEAGTLKIILDQTGVVDTISVYANGQLLTSTRNSVLDGHKMNGLQSSALLPAAYQGQEFNFADTIYGIWGSPSDMEIYVDNFKAYLIDSFSIASVEVDGSTSAFEASTDSVVYKFTGEVDPATVKDAVAIYDAEGNAVPTALKSATLEDGNKTLRVVLAKSIAGESEYKVAITDSIKDIYGSGIANDYEWYEYPIDDYYTAEDGLYTVNSILCQYTPASGTTGAKMALADGTRPTFVDCYVPVPAKANREVTFTTSRKIVVTNVSPAVVPGYDLGRDQEITITLAEALDANINLAEAFTVTDEDGKDITGLSATFGDTTNVIKLQLSGLALGNGKHLIESVDGALVNAEGIFANISISVSTVDFMVTYAEPGSDVITEYKEGDNQEIVLGLSSSADVADGVLTDCFEVTDEDGNKVPGIQATYKSNNASRTDDDTIVLQLSGVQLGRGKHTIKATSNLVDRRGRALSYEYTFTKLPFKAEYAATLSDYEPKTDKEIEIKLTYELSDDSIANINNAFIVENEENLRVSGLTASVSEDKKVIKLQLKDLDITGGEYKITSKSGVIFSAANEELAGIMITVDTGTGAAFGPTTGEGSGSGTPLEPGTSFETVVLLDENFENSIEKAEAGIEFVPSVNWYTSPEKIPYGFKVEKKGLEYRDAKVAVVPDPADPSSGNMVLMNDSGYYAKDGSVAASPLSTSAAPNYTIVSRSMDNEIEIPKDKYTQIRMSSKIYVPSKTINYLPLSGEQLRNSEYIIAGTSNAGKTINPTNFAKHTNGQPKFHTYISKTTDTDRGVSGSFDLTFTPDEWHTMEYVFSVFEFVGDGNALKGGYQLYIDGVAVKDGIAFVANDYETINGMMSRIVAADRGGSVVVYYDDWKITKETKYATHVDIPAANVPEDQDITLTLTKALDADSVKLIEESLADDSREDLIIVKDEDGNVVDANITITDGNVITIDPINGLKYNTEYLVEVKSTTKVNGIEHRLKSTDGEEYQGIAYPFETAKARDTYIDAEASAASFNCFSTEMESATRFAYTMNLSGAHAKDVIAAVAVYNEKEELIGVQYKTIPAGSTQTAFDFNTVNGKTGGKVTRMYIWEAKTDGSRGRLMQSPDEITSR